MELLLGVCIGFSIGFAVCSILVIRRKRIIIDKLVAALKAVLTHVACNQCIKKIEAALADAKETP